jgi:hypothetical protein
MEPRITQTTQDVSELAPLERSIDAIELADEDLEKVTGAFEDFRGFGHFRHFGHFGHFRHFGHFGHFRHFGGSTAIAISSVSIAG